MATGFNAPKYLTGKEESSWQLYKALDLGKSFFLANSLFIHDYKSD